MGREGSRAGRENERLEGDREGAIDGPRMGGLILRTFYCDVLEVLRNQIYGVKLVNSDTRVDQ